MAQITFLENAIVRMLPTCSKMVNILIEKDDAVSTSVFQRPESVVYSIWASLLCLCLCYVEKNLNI